MGLSRKGIAALCLLALAGSAHAEEQCALDYEKIAKEMQAKILQRFHNPDSNDSLTAYRAPGTSDLPAVNSERESANVLVPSHSLEATTAAPANPVAPGEAAPPVTSPPHVEEPAPVGEPNTSPPRDNAPARPPIPSPRNALDRWRDNAVTFLNTLPWRRRDFPAQSFEDMTQMKVKAFAQDGLNLSVKQDLPFTSAQAKTDIEERLKNVLSFHERYKKYEEETVDAKVRLDAMQAAKSDALKTSHDISLKLPLVKIGADGKITITEITRTFATREMYINEMSELEKLVRDRTKIPLFRLSGNDDLVVQQVSDLKNLEIYLKYARDLKNKNPGSQMDAQSQALLDKIAALRKPATNGDPAAGQWVEDLRLPYWAWRNLHWKEFGAEMRSLIQKDLPQLKDTVENNKVFQFLKNMSPEEQREFGITNLAKSANFWARNKYVSILLGGGPPGYGVFELSKYGYDILMKDPIAKEKCAANDADTAFTSCARKYLEDKYTIGRLSAAFPGNGMAHPELIKDEKIKAEVLDIINRRRLYHSSQAQDSAVEARFTKGVQAIQSTTDPLSKPYYLNVMQMDHREIYVIGLKKILDAQFEASEGLNAAGDLVLQAVNLPDEPSRNQMLEGLRKQAGDEIIDFVEKAEKDHKKVLGGGSLTTNSQPPGILTPH